MEIYKNLSTPASKEFEQLLNNQLSKTKIEEGKIVEGKINKITEKFVFLFIDGLKSEPILDINELKSLGFHLEYVGILLFYFVSSLMKSLSGYHVRTVFIYHWINSQLYRAADVKVH